MLKTQIQLYFLEITVFNIKQFTKLKLLDLYLKFSNLKEFKESPHSNWMKFSQGLT